MIRKEGDDKESVGYMALELGSSYHRIIKVLDSKSIRNLTVINGAGPRTWNKAILSIIG